MNDPYLDTMTCIHRLYDDYTKHGKLVIAYDFDNTVYDCHDLGYDFADVRALLRAAEIQGHTLICYTANNEIEFVMNYLTDSEIPYTMINESPVDTGGGKIYYNILLDDRAGLQSAFQTLKGTMSLINTLKGINK